MGDGRLVRHSHQPPLPRHRRSKSLSFPYNKPHLTLRFLPTGNLLQPCLSHGPLHDNTLTPHGHRVGDDFRDGEDEKISLKDFSKKLQEFAHAREWEKYHTPRNLLLAMVGEVGELAEIFQWKGEVENWEESEKEHLGEELSDVLLYLIRLADICGIDLTNAALNKIHKNAIKYPPPLDS
ncbi:hypothetical protein R6Q57_001840 [Mikania cordata]